MLRYFQVIRFAKILLVLSCSLWNYGYGQVSFFDNFSGDTLSSIGWTLSTQTPGSSVSVQNGYVEMMNGGTIINNYTFEQPTYVDSKFQLANNEKSNLKYVLRSDGIKYFSERKGVAVQLSCSEDWNGYINQISIFELGNSSSITPGPVISNLIQYTTPLNLNTWYDLRIIDNGNKVDVFFNGSSSPTLSLSTSFSAGNSLAIYNRHGGADGSWISEGGTARVDYISIIPEPSALSLLAVGLGVVLRRHRRAV